VSTAKSVNEVERARL